MFKKAGSLCLIICVILSLHACAYATYTDSMSDYLVSDAALSFPELILFPQKETIAEDDIIMYQSEEISTIIDDDVYFILCCRYSTDVYADEIARFKESNAVFDETLFAFPAYVMLFTGDNYEYVLLDELNNTVIYVAAQTAGWEMFEKLPEQYLPLTKPDIDICRYQYDFR